MVQFNAVRRKFPRSSPQKPEFIVTARLAVQRVARPILLACLVCGIFACSPAFNWRECRPEGSGATLLFPCKPTETTRAVTVENVSLTLHMSACEVQGQVFALAYAQVPLGADPAGIVLGLRNASAQNLAPARSTELPLQIPGMTPNAAAQRSRWEATRPDGRALSLDAAYFSRGAQVYQASIVGTSKDEDIAQMFFSSLSLAR